MSPVLAVPFDDGGAVDLAGFRGIVRHVLGTGVSSVMFPGYASEFHKLDDAERAALVAVLLAETALRPDVAAVGDGGPVSAWLTGRRNGRTQFEVDGTRQSCSR